MNRPKRSPNAGRGDFSQAHGPNQVPLVLNGTPQSSNQSIEPSSAPTVWTRIAPAVPTAVYDTYWRFAVERQAVFFRRLQSLNGPWTSDDIISRYKFTNAYRASDRVSQYLIRNVIYVGSQEPVEIFFRTLLFKVFNRIDTWELLQGVFGELTYRGFSHRLYSTVLSEAMNRGQRIYSAAYIMPSGSTKKTVTAGRKHDFHLALIAEMIRSELPKKLVEASSMRAAFELLRSYRSIGDFLAYQFVTDLNYAESLRFSENDFVVPGPGARDGLRKCFASFGGLNESEVIRLVADRQEAEFSRLGLTFYSLWGRTLQLIDCQNLFCEVDKYSRVRHPEVKGRTERKRIKQQFSPSAEPLSVWYPPKWCLNDRIAEDPTGLSIGRFAVGSR